MTAPFDSLISIETSSPWTLRVSQTKQDGFPDLTICYSCSNKDSITSSVEQTLTNNIVLSQGIDCRVALDAGNSTSSLKGFYDPIETHYAAYDYAASPEFKTLAPYTDSTKMFSNTNSWACGAFTTCYPLPQGCTGTYSGYAKFETTTLAL